MTDFVKPFPEIKKKSKKKLLASRLLLKSLVYSFAIFGALFILLLLIVLGMIRQDMGNVVLVPKSAVLAIDFDADYTETRGDDILAEITGSRPQIFLDLVKAINVAAADERIKAIAATINSSSLGLAQIQDLRDAIKSFQASGKKAYLFSSGFGNFGQGTKEYYLATAFDKITLAPNSDVGITGISMEIPFFRKVLDKIGVKPEFYSRYEYKTAMASVTDFQMSAPYKEEMTRLGNSIFNRFLEDSSSARNISKEEFKKLVDKAPINSGDAIKSGLIDEISYKLDWKKSIEKQYKSKVINISDYIANISGYYKNVPAIAFLVIDGVITEGESYASSIRGETITGSDSVLRQVDDILEDEDVKALVVRVNSPGGSYGASNEIRHALEQVKHEKKLPIIVSMGDYAASGGYFVSLVGDKIIAEPSTITGSIGVLGGKMVLSNLWEKLGVNWEMIKFGQNSGILSSNTQFNKKEKHNFNKSLDAIYEDFTLKVSESRKINLKDLNKLARGRVWSGEDALKHGLVDDIGGIEKALSQALADAKIKPDEKFRIIYYPKEKTLQEKIQQLISGGKSVLVRQIVDDFYDEIIEINKLKRLQYDAVLLPIKVNM